MALVTDTHTKTKSPEGTAELSPGRSPGYASANRVVPKGRLKEFGHVSRPSGTTRLLDPTQDCVLG
jgi:hypothetical protein